MIEQSESRAVLASKHCIPCIEPHSERELRDVSRGADLIAVGLIETTTRSSFDQAYERT